MRLAPKIVAMLGVVALPVGTLMLAKLFDSAVLGWMFGLMLMLGMALLPLLAIGYGAYRILRWIINGRRFSEAIAANDATLTVQVERAGVHASDDAPSRQINVPVDCTVREFASLAMADGMLPHVSGAQATWVLQFFGGGNGHGPQPVAMWSQGWQEPAFVADPDRPAASLFVSATARVRFDYRCLDDPAAVLKELRAR